MASERRASSDRSVERLAYLAAVVDASSDAILSKSLDGTITSWNASAERIFGFTAEEMVGQNIRRLIPAELQTEEDEILAKLRAGQFIDHFETVRMTKSGSRLDVSLSISPIMNGEGEVVGAAKIARDVTSRKQADALLAATTAKFESVFNQSGIFAGILDLDGKRPSGQRSRRRAVRIRAGGRPRLPVLGDPVVAGITRRCRHISAPPSGSRGRRGSSGRRSRTGSPTAGERIVEFAMHPIRDERRGRSLPPSDRDRHHRSDARRGGAPCAGGRGA